LQQDDLASNGYWCATVLRCNVLNLAKKILVYSLGACEITATLNRSGELANLSIIGVSPCISRRVILDFVRFSVQHGAKYCRVASATPLARILVQLGGDVYERSKVGPTFALTALRLIGIELPHEIDIDHIGIVKFQ
jgi:hypothetical protein